MNNAEPVAAQAAAFSRPASEQDPQLGELDLEARLQACEAKELGQSSPVSLPEETLRQGPADIPLVCACARSALAKAAS